MISVTQWVLFLGICIICACGNELEDPTRSEDYGSLATENQLSPRALSSPRRTCASDGACTKACKRQGHDYGQCSSRRCICDDYPSSIKRMVKGGSSTQRRRLTASRSKTYSRTSKSPRRGSSPRRSLSRSPSRRLRSPSRNRGRGSYSSPRRSGSSSPRRRTSSSPSTRRRKGYRTPPRKVKSPGRRAEGSRSPRRSRDSRDDRRDSRDDRRDSRDDRRDSRDDRRDSRDDSRDSRDDRRDSRDDYKSSSNRPADVLSFDYSPDGRPPKVTYSQRQGNDGPPQGLPPSNSYQKGSRLASNIEEDLEEHEGAGGMQGMGAAKPPGGGRVGGKQSVGDYNGAEEEEPDLQFAQKTPPPPVRGKGPKLPSASDQQVPPDTEFEDEMLKSGGKQKPLPPKPVGRADEEGLQPEEEEEEEGMDGRVEEQLGGGTGRKPPAGKQSPADLADENDDADFMANGNGKLPKGGMGMGDIGEEEELDDESGLPSGKNGGNQNINGQQSMEDVYGKMPGKSPPFGPYDREGGKSSGAPASKGNDQMGGHNSGAKLSSAAKADEFDDMDDMDFKSMGDPSGQSSYGNGGFDMGDDMDFESKMGQKPSKEPAASSGKRPLPPVKNGKVAVEDSSGLEGTAKQPVPENQGPKPAKKLKEKLSSTADAEEDDLDITGVTPKKAAPQTDKKPSTMPSSIPDFDESHADIHGNIPKNAAAPGISSAVSHLDDDDELEMPLTKMASTSLKKPSAKPSNSPAFDDVDSDFLGAAANRPVPLTGKNSKAKSSIDADFDDYDMEDLGTSLKKPPSASKRAASVPPQFDDEEDDDLFGENLKGAKTPSNAAKLSKGHLGDMDSALEDSKETVSNGIGAKKTGDSGEVKDSHTLSKSAFKPKSSVANLGNENNYDDADDLDSDYSQAMLSSTREKGGKSVKPLGLHDG